MSFCTVSSFRNRGRGLESNSTRGSGDGSSLQCSPAGSQALLLAAFSWCLWESRGPGQPPVPGAEPSEEEPKEAAGASQQVPRPSHSSWQNAKAAPRLSVIRHFLFYRLVFKTPLAAPRRLVKVGAPVSLSITCLRDPVGFIAARPV